MIREGSSRFGNADELGVFDTSRDKTRRHRTNYKIGAWGYLWFWVPARTAPAAVQVLHDHIVKAITHPDLHNVMTTGGSEVSGLSPSETMREARRLSDIWGGVIRELGVKLD